MTFFAGSLNCKPVPKGRPRIGKWGGVFTPKETRAFEKLVKDWVKALHTKKPSEKALKVNISFYFKRAKSNTKKMHTQKPDLDNVAKAILDSTEGILFVNDSQIVELNLNKYFADYVNEGFTISIWEQEYENELKPTQAKKRGVKK